jgi:hypothetical protein
MNIPSTQIAAQKSSKRGLLVSILLISVGLHVAAGIIAGIVVVARYLTPPPAEFKATRDVRLPAKKREAKMNMAALDAIAPKPTFSDKMQSSRPTAFALPDLPKLPIEQMMPLDPAHLISDQIASMSNIGAMGSGSGSGTAGGGGFGDKGTSFLGIQSNGERILLLFDVSSSVANKAAQSGMPLQKIQQETLTLIQKLPATDNNRSAAKKWVETEWVDKGTMPANAKDIVSNPRGLAGVLHVAAEMKPDVIYLISDGSFQQKTGNRMTTIPWDQLHKLVEEKFPRTQSCRINFIAFQAKKEDASEMKSLANKTNGRLVEIK